MKPLNTEERKKSFTSFLLFFIVTIIVVITGVYFGMQVPFMQNERLKEEVSRFQRDNVFAENFSGKMAETKRYLDSVNKNGTQATLVDGLITTNIKALQAMVGTDSSGNKELYNNMVQSFVELQIAKQTIRDYGNKDANLASSAQELTDVKMQLSQCKQENLTYMQLLRNTPAAQHSPQP